MKTTLDMKQRIETMPMYASDRAHVLQSYIAAEAIVDALFAVGGWISRLVSTKAHSHEKHGLDKHAIAR
jgi:hypothetical protein